LANSSSFTSKKIRLAARISSMPDIIGNMILSFLEHSPKDRPKLDLEEFHFFQAEPYGPQSNCGFSSREVFLSG